MKMLKPTGIIRCPNDDVQMLEAYWGIKNNIPRWRYVCPKCGYHKFFLGEKEIKSKEVKE